MHQSANKLSQHNHHSNPVVTEVRKVVDTVAALLAAMARRHPVVMEHTKTVN